MESNLRNLPTIPDSPSYYILMMSIVDCYDQLQKRTEFIDDISFIQNKMSLSIHNWRIKNIR